MSYGRCLSGVSFAAGRPKGQTRILRALSYEEAQKTQVVEVNPDRSPGAYQIGVLG